MATHKVAELDGIRLNQAVAIAAGMQWRWLDGAPDGIPAPGFLQTYHDVRLRSGGYWGTFWPSQDWGDAGPIIERERIGFQHHSFNQSGKIVRSVDAFITGHRPSSAPTMLIAAMRAFVASRLGETVELP